MKKLFKVIGSIFVLGTVILLLLHVFLLYGLTKTMRDVVLPQVKEQTGIDVRVDGLSLNIPNGRMTLKGVEIRNPEGFLIENAASVDRVYMELDIPSLLKQKLILVRDVSVEDALVNIIRNRNGEINFIKLQEGLPQSASPVEGAPEERPAPSGEGESVPATPVEIPEVLIEKLAFHTMLRYVDLKLEKLGDIVLDLELAGKNLGTQRGPEAEWGALTIDGSLGDDKNSFVTELLLKLAPVVDPQILSFDLTGTIMEIDPKIMQDIYDDLGIRSAPFGFDPDIHCRDSRFENSSFALNLNSIRLEDKLADRLGGMASIESLRFPVTLEGTLTEPKVDVPGAFMSALGGNVENILGSLIKGAAKEAGLDEVPENITDAAVEILGQHVEEIGENEDVKKVLKDLADGKPSDTNAPAPAVTDVLIDILGNEVDEIGNDEVLKEGLKGLGRKLFGN
ncbi:MAG: AsmA family protein [Pontiellaceae bacterium]|nr:AsmA family protein [Pontiellaceae bacterium]MBN2784392.1 AsmA family protein [Pontiellaceae bacterium]